MASTALVHTGRSHLGRNRPCPDGSGGRSWPAQVDLAGSGPAGDRVAGIGGPGPRHCQTRMRSGRAGRRHTPFSADAVLGTDELGRRHARRLIWADGVCASGILGTMLVAALTASHSDWSRLFRRSCRHGRHARHGRCYVIFPAVLLAIAIVAGLGPGLVNAMVSVALVGFPLYARLVRSMTLSLREREFVESALRARRHPQGG